MFKITSKRTGLLHINEWWCTTLQVIMDQKNIQGGELENKKLG